MRGIHRRKWLWDWKEGKGWERLGLLARGRGEGRKRRRIGVNDTLLVGK